MSLTRRQSHGETELNPTRHLLTGKPGFSWEPGLGGTAVTPWASGVAWCPSGSCSATSKGGAMRCNGDVKVGIFEVDGCKPLPLADGSTSAVVNM